jgi:hypothetical protein
MALRVDALWFGDPSDQAAFRHAAIAKAAYFCAQRRDFAPGSEVDDWLTAERELHRLPEHNGSPREDLRRSAGLNLGPASPLREVKLVGESGAHPRSDRTHVTEDPTGPH